MKKMTSRERLTAAMRHEDLDRIPLSPRLQHVVMRHFGSVALWAYRKLKANYFDYDPTFVAPFPAVNPFYSCWDRLDYLNDVEVNVRHEDKGDHFLLTRCFSTPAGNLSEKIMSPKPGAKHYGATPNPHKVENLIKSREDLARLNYLMPPLESLNFAEYHRAVEEMGDDGMVFMYLFGPLTHLAGDACSMQDLMLAYYEDNDLFRGIVGLFSEYAVKMVDVALENGVRNFFLSYYYESLSSGWSPKIIGENFIPVLKRQVDLIHRAGGFADYYDDGRLMESVEMFVGAGVDVIETCSPAPAGDFDLAEARRRLGLKVTFKGCIDMINIIDKGSPELIESNLRETIALNGGKRGMILGTMDGIRPETSDENIAAYFNAANRWR